MYLKFKKKKKYGKSKRKEKKTRETEFWRIWLAKIYGVSIQMLLNLSRILNMYSLQMAYTHSSAYLFS